MSATGLARRLASAAAVAVFFVIVASAWLRHSPEASADAIAVARMFHRVVATLALVLVVAVAYVSRRDPDRGVRTIAYVAVGIVVALAVLGVARATSPLVVLGNLGGGFALLATLVVLAARLRGRPPVQRSRLVARIALATAASAVAAPVVAGPIAVHFAAGTLVLPLAAAAVEFANDDRAVAAAIAASTLASVAAGIAAVAMPGSLAVTLAHNATSALLVASLAVAAFRRGSSVPVAAGHAAH